MDLPPLMSDPAAPTAPPEPQPQHEPGGPGDCPRCQHKLIDPEGLGWCKSCGYCRSLEEERARGPVPAVGKPKPSGPPRPSKLGLSEFVDLLRKTPSWAWGLLAGMAAVVLLTLTPALALPEDSLPRALWCTLQIVIGAVMLFGGQVAALAMVAGDDERLTFKDALLPLRLWVTAVRRLPETRRPLWVSAWGLTAILSAVLLVGGLTHWFSYLPRSANARPAAAQAK